MEFPSPHVKPKADEEETPQPLFEKLSIDQYKQTNDKLLQTEMDLMDLPSRCFRPSSPNPRRIRNSRETRSTSRRVSGSSRSSAATRRWPRLIEQIKATSDELEHDKSIARRDADPAVIAARKRLANLTADYNDLWSIRSEQIRQRLLVETGGLGSGESAVILRRKIEALEAKKNNLVQMLAKIEVQKQQSSTDTLKATFLREEINSLTGNIRTVEQKLEQLKFESSNQLVRVFVQDQAVPPQDPLDQQAQQVHGDLARGACCSP